MNPRWLEDVRMFADGKATFRRLLDDHQRTTRRIPGNYKDAINEVLDFQVTKATRLRGDY